MTSTSHHPSPDLMLSYSAGAASPSQALCVATHLEFCQSCRAAHKRNNAIGGKLIDQLETSDDMQISDSLKSKVLNLLDRKRPEPQSKVAIDKDSSEITASKAIPRALKKLIPKDFSSLDWKMASISARSCQLFKDDSGANVSLLKLKPGGRIAKHKHLGSEYTVILTGSFSDEKGVYRQGDFLFLDSNDSHSPVATRDAECICLILQEAPLQFTGWLFKLFNPIARSQFQAS